VDVVVARMRAGVAGAGADVVLGDDVVPEHAESTSAAASETTAQRVARRRGAMTGDDMTCLLKNSAN
jgi:hypothetical protein